MTKSENQKLLEHSEAIVRLEEKTDYIKRDVSEIKETVKGQNAILSSLSKTLEDKMEKFFERADNRYASKEYENIVKAAVSIILVAFMGLVLYYIGWQK